MCFGRSFNHQLGFGGLEMQTFENDFQSAKVRPLSCVNYESVYCENSDIMHMPIMHSVYSVLYKMTLPTTGLTFIIFNVFVDSCER